VHWLIWNLPADAVELGLNLPPGVNRSDLEAAMAGHILAQGTTMGIYQRRKE
jgi:phosphatidylethanolamine-binding protein (PEBP) family uncharacterized protein